MSIATAFLPTVATVSKPSTISPLAVGLRDAARLLGVSTSWLHQRAKAGEVPSALIGGRRVFRVASLDAWLQERERVDGRSTGAPQSEI